jgi:hypothetical protein
MNEQLITKTAKIPAKLNDEFHEVGLNFQVWLLTSMKNAVYLQKRLNELIRSSVEGLKGSTHQMSSHGVSESPDQSHPDHKQTDTE